MSAIDQKKVSERLAKFFDEDHQFKKEMGILRKLALNNKVEETFKWMFPTYTLNHKNVYALAKFKDHFGIWFFNGVFLSDPLNVLQNAQQGKTHGMRHWKFHKTDPIDAKMVLQYLQEAIANEEKGMRLKPIKATEKKYEVPDFFNHALQHNEKLEKAFYALSPSKQNDYLDYLGSAKREPTKQSRLEKAMLLIMEGKGLNDKYR